jgi:translation initiation factor eIF-2B subunit delta
LERTFTQLIASVANDRHSGAAQIADRAADILLRRATSGEASSPAAFRREMLNTGWALINAQTAMAPLVNLVNIVLWSIETSESPQRLREAVAEATEAFKRCLRRHAVRVAEEALGLIDERATIVTLSYSSTVQHALMHAQRAGRRLEVLCAESRPGGEGHATVDVLMNCGIPARLLVDGQAIAAIEHADLVLVGADMLTSRGLVNKTGTRAMAEAARAAGKPCYTLCSSEKFLPPGFQPLQPSVRSAARRWSDVAGARHARQLVFDFTPLDRLPGIVTEEGILPIEAIEAWMAATRLHPALARCADEELHAYE